MRGKRVKPDVEVAVPLHRLPVFVDAAVTVGRRRDSGLERRERQEGKKTRRGGKEKKRKEARTQTAVAEAVSTDRAMSM